MRFLYIHGFASSPGSRKAQAFRKALEIAGARVDVPAMDEGEFENLTITRQLALLERCIGEGPTALIGSSMGGYLAGIYASMHPTISRLVLLAPAFGFARRWQEKARQAGNGEVPEWLDVYHYGEQRMCRVHSGLLDDALRFPPYPMFSQPALIFHGIHDDTVPIDNSRKLAAEHSNARLVELDSDHELLDVLDRITEESMKFLLSEEPKIHV